MAAKLARAAAGSSGSPAGDRCGPRTRHGGPGFGGSGFGFGGPGFGGPGPWAKGFWGQSPPRAKKGNVRAAALVLLAERPFNGYQLIQEIEERSGGAWRPSPGAVYPALQQLADEGLIEAVEEGGRKDFHLTEAGRAYVDEHLSDLDAPWNAMTPPDAGEYQDLFKVAAQTGAAIFQVAQAGTAEQRAEAAKVLADTRRRLYRILADDDAEETS
ncbi:PadR family transcriptional regulator [Actinomadura craniellae]|uniref:PadR family transcriptional regulator n=2 Tax=Actinomadura craniellae TaxID=2231787 RepID=A0A365GY51_9ACTN|nr:PadR family transcriptional regulator [Actinomadura craniellae]